MPKWYPLWSALAAFASATLAEASFACRAAFDGPDFGYGCLYFPFQILHPLLEPHNIELLDTGHRPPVLDVKFQLLALRRMQPIGLHVFRQLVCP